MLHVCSAMLDPPWPHELQPTRLLCPWDAPGKNTGVGCRFIPAGDLSDPGIEPETLVFSAPVGEFSTVAPPGKLKA